MFGPCSLGAFVIQLSINHCLSSFHCLVPRGVYFLSTPLSMPPRSTKNTTSRAQSGKKNAASSTSAPAPQPTTAKGKNKATPKASKKVSTQKDNEAKISRLSPSDIARLLEIKEQLELQGKQAGGDDTSANQPDHERKSIIYIPVLVSINLK